LTGPSVRPAIGAAGPTAARALDIDKLVVERVAARARAGASAAGAADAPEAPLPSELGATVDTLLNHLSLLFVPAGIGVVQHFDRLPTAITLAVTALVFTGVARLMKSRTHDDEPGTLP